MGENVKKFVLLDLDDTLYDFHKAERIALVKTLQAFGLESNTHIIRRYSEINAALWRLLEQGKLTRDKLKEQRYRLLFEESGIDADPIKAARTYEHNLSIGHYFIDGAEDLLEALYRDFELYLVTNGSVDIQSSRIASGKIERFFRGIFISEAVGFNKPDVVFFETVFARIPNFEKEKAVIVGDSLSSDIQGGKNAGITTVWFHSSEQAVEPAVNPDHQICSLLELPSLLKSL